METTVSAQWHKLEAELADILKDIKQDADDELNALIEETGERLVSRLKQDSPVDTGDYAAGWEMRSEWSGIVKSRVVYNSAKPHLTHLLEYGRSDGEDEKVGRRPHIAKALREITDELDARLKGGNGSGA